MQNEFMWSSFLPKCQPKITRISPLSNKQGWSSKKLHTITKKVCYDPCLFGRAEILVIFGWHFGRNDDLINSFWIQLTFKEAYPLEFHQLVFKKVTSAALNSLQQKKGQFHTYFLSQLGLISKIEFMILDGICNIRYTNKLEMQLLSKTM